MKHRVIAALLFLIAGAMTTVFVAWLSAYSSPAMQRRSTMVGSFGAVADPHAGAWLVVASRWTGLTSMMWHWYEDLAQTEEYLQFYLQFARDNWPMRAPGGAGAVAGEFHLPAWSAIHHGDPDAYDASLPTPELPEYGEVFEPGHLLTFYEVAVGWPFRCFRGTQLTRVAAMGYVPIKSLGLYPPNPTPGRRIYPYRPILRGMALNTLFYAALFASPWLLFHQARGFRRRREGRCMNCGYDRRGLETGARCPECGR